MNINGKHITILGAVRSGFAAAKLAKSLGAIPFVSDLSDYEKLKDNFDGLKKEKIDFEFGTHSSRVYDCDFIVTSPGVPSRSEVLIEAKKRNIEVISEIEFASWFCKGDIIAITGSNGKTTTTMLTGHLFNHCGKKAFLAGNVGTAFSDIALDVEPGDIVALEVSSFQLDFVKSFQPKISVILNVTPDHLDRYENNFENYLNSKLRVFCNQTVENYYVSNADDKNLSTEITNKDVARYMFSLNNEVEKGTYLLNDEIVFIAEGKKEIVCAVKDISLKGEHNIANVMAVVNFAKIYNLDSVKIKEALATFPGVEHRLEFVRRVNGVDYINDSKATNVDSVWYALRSFDKPLYLILGGKDKGNDYSQILDPVKANVKKIYAIGSSAKKVFDYFTPYINVEIIDSLEECVSKANEEAESDSIVLLSPACASFDMFENYEHRGKVFKEAVKKLVQ